MRRGYLLKSSDGPNCVGLTKIETTIGEDSPFAARISEKWPSCSAPIVGTRPRRRSDARAACAICFIHSIVWIVSIRLVRDENRDCGGAAWSADACFRGGGACLARFGCFDHSFGWKRLNARGGKAPHSILISPALGVRKSACASMADDASHALACAARSR